MVFAQVQRLVPSGLDCRITLDISLYELGLGSLARMEALNCLEEKFGVRFSEDSLFDLETCRDVVGYIEANAAQGSLGRPSPELGEVARQIRHGDLAAAWSKVEGYAPTCVDRHHRNYETQKEWRKKAAA